MSTGLLRPLALRGTRDLEPVARGVWRIQGQPGRLNVYFIEDGDGTVVQFDAGGRMMLDQVRGALGRLAPLKLVVLGHGHTDHRGTAPFLGAPVTCHADEVVDAEGTGGFRYWGRDLAGVPQPRRFLQRELLHPRFWDGGPVPIAHTIAEGDTVAGFRVVHLPGHSPGLIALLREHDGLALVSDAFYTIDPWGRDSPPHLPDAVWNWDSGEARRALGKLAGLDLAQAWPGHGDPVREDTASTLRRAAAGPVA